MKTDQLVLVAGARATRDTLAEWRTRPASVVRPWVLVSFCVALGLLYATWIVAAAAKPDATPLFLPGLTGPAGGGDVGHILLRNGLVLALHGFACVAGFIAGSSLPLEAESKAGAWRRVHDVAGPLAIGFVTLATLFSLATQAYVIGHDASTLAAQLDLHTGELMLALLPHALPELTALFLPLAAWLVASRAHRWDELLAATAVTVSLAIPVLVACSLWETYGYPRLLGAIAG